ncbi:MAG TPA: hypothetical protein VFG39_03470, partial [Balneolaceae bacterium]|nr:hypothetical protein [Balneolaceae bacterium]
DKAKHHAEALARTGVIYTSNQSNNEFYRENADLIKNVNVVLTLDSRTCLTCFSYAQENPYPLENHPTPPFHVNCRCTTVPVTKSWNELGIDLDEAPKGTRASMSGQVPEDVTYLQWLKRQSADIQKEALGASRYRLWKQGDIEITSFVSDTGEILTLEQLRRKEADIFEDLNISL